MTSTWRQLLLIATMITVAFIPSDNHVVRAADETEDVSDTLDSNRKQIPRTEGVLVQGVTQLADPPTNPASSDSGTASGTQEPTTGVASPAKDPSVLPKKPRSIESRDLILKETKDGLSGYSKSLGKWDRIVAAAPKNGSTRMEHATVGLEFASVLIDDQVFGFSSKAGRWGQLTIPPQFLGKALPQIDMTSLSIRLGDEIYALSPATGQWMSSDGTPVEAGQTISFTYSGMDSSAPTEKTARAKLLESIAEHEKLTEVLAKQVRELRAKRTADEEESPQLTELRRRLHGELAKVFDMKNQLEKIRVKELQTRLSQLEQQIGQRQSQRDQIIERRARELIQDDSTKWTADESNTAGNDRTTFKAPRRSSNTEITPKSNTTQVSFRFTDKSSATIEYDGQTYPLPFRFNFERSEKDTRGYRLKLLVASTGIERPIDLYICSATPNSATFLAHNSVAFEISMKDLASSNLDTAKAIYLPTVKFQELAAQDAQTVRVVNGNTTTAVFAEAERLGTPLAALILHPSTSGPTSPDAESAGEAKIGTAGVVMSTSPSYKQWAIDFETVEHDLATAQIELNYNKKLFENKVISAGEVAIHQGKFDTAQRKLDILKTALKAELQDLALQLNSDKVELSAANSAQERLASSPHTQSQLDTATRRTDQARLTVQRRSLQYDLLSELAKKLKLFPDDSPQPQSSASEIEKRIHSKWKMRLVGMTRDETNALSKTKYQGGLRVAEVEPDGPAGRNGINVDDVLVGLDKWETPTFENVGWIFNLAASDKTSDSIKFYIIRAGEVKFGTLPLDGDKTPNPPGGN